MRLGETAKHNDEIIIVHFAVSFLCKNKVFINNFTQIPHF